MYPLRVKICGVTTVDDALQAALLGADAIGLNFYPGSPRCVTMAQAERILEELPPFVEPVAVFVRESLANIRAVMARLGLRTFQWHGDSPPFPEPPLRMITAFAVTDSQSLQTISAYLDACEYCPAAVLVDAQVLGGTGQAVPLDLLKDFDPVVDWILAGGLTPRNVASAIAAVKPYGVDVASGVESSPGRKNPNLMRSFIEAAKVAR